MTTKNALMAVAAGIATGAVLGAVLATKTYRKQSISKKGEALIKAINDRIDERFEELRLSAREKAGSQRGHAA